MAKKAVLFIDIVSSSAMWSTNSNNMKITLKNFDILVRKLLKKHKNAFIVKTLGDAYMISFQEWYDAYNFAKTLQLTIPNQQHILSFTNTIPFKVRIGIAYGEVDVQTVSIQNAKLKDLFGNVVNTASRMESKVCPNGGIGITVISREDINDFVHYIMEDLKDDEYKYEIFSFNQDCLNLKKKMFERSSRLLNNFHYTCKSLDELKGVEHVDFCFKIYLE